MCAVESDKSRNGVPPCIKQILWPGQLKDAIPITPEPICTKWVNPNVPGNLSHIYFYHGRVIKGFISSNDNPKLSLFFIMYSVTVSVQCIAVT